MTAPLRIRNRDARRLFLSAQGLAETPTGPLDLEQLIHDLGFVQLDTIQVVARAHHHILWSRNQHYREPMLDRHMVEHRRVFEHFTHDASLIPMDFYPMWQRQFRRLEASLRRRGWHVDDAGESSHETVRRRIEIDGPLSTRDFNAEDRGNRDMWSLPSHKRALEYLWYAGELSTSHRVNFTKYYDLTERVIPGDVLDRAMPEQDQVHWLCTAALDRLSFGAEGDIQRFWDAVDSAEARSWANENRKNLVSVEVEGADRVWRKALAPADIEGRLKEAPSPTSRLRIINPFDPVIRDRTRLERLFGFDYRVEMFVPAKQRRWGYYVYPLLEGDRFVGRIEVKANRKAGTLTVLNLWPEAKVAWTPSREARLQSELGRLARFVGVDWPGTAVSTTSDG
ncbi:MAG: crosslink repair DNA glycosylase YcaQ family protein [Woeseiaceae bacterium]|nr:crosslink repair DNA glycosylase YcaQ family protein [Woeseiaceae bacterium]